MEEQGSYLKSAEDYAAEMNTRLKGTGEARAYAVVKEMSNCSSVSRERPYVPLSE